MCLFLEKVLVRDQTSLLIKKIRRAADSYIKAKVAFFILLESVEYNLTLATGIPILVCLKRKTRFSTETAVTKTKMAKTFILNILNPSGDA
jgi:hypothetical protein